MNPKIQQLIEDAAKEYFQKVNPHLKEDKYYQENLHERSQTYRACVDSALFGFTLATKMHEGVVGAVSVVCNNATHVCPNDSLAPVEQCILCLVLEKLDNALAKLKEELKD